MLISFRATTERVGAVRVILILALALLLGDCANTVTETPAGIEIETLGKTPQEIADEAQARCQKYGLDAQLKDAHRGLLSAHELFDCVNKQTARHNQSVSYEPERRRTVDRQSSP
jgi:hypothetical protein